MGEGLEIILLGAASGVLFWAMAVVTEFRFVPTLVVLSDRMGIPKDVAGATLMAAGASSPELFSNMVSMFVTKSDLGIGTIIGSEIFNHMMILAGVCASRDGPQRLDRLTTIRDNCAYGASLALLLGAVCDVRRHGYADDDDRDDNSKVVVHSYSPLPLLGLYAAYVYLCSESGRSLLARLCGGGAVAAADGGPASTKAKAVDEEAAVVALLYKGQGDDGAPVALASYGAAAVEEGIVAAHAEETAVFVVPRLASATPAGVVRFAADVVLAPAAFVIDATLFHPTNETSVCGLGANIAACATWLVGFSYGMVVALERIGALLHISSAVMGLTVAAVGTSFPNLVSSMVAARDGHANMAVSNALGSNTFNLCICLGLPWFIYPFVYGEPYEALHDYSVVFDTSLLAVVLLVYVAVLVAYDYTLHAPMGYVFAVSWLVFLVASIVAGRNIDVIENRIQGGH